MLSQASTKFQQNSSREIFQKTKFSQLITAIQHQAFPIVVFGPSGTGKTFTVLKALEKLQIKHRYVELAGQSINKPIDNSIMTIVHLYNYKDLENIKFSKNLIIETCIPWNNKFQLNLREHNNPLKICHESYSKGHSSSLNLASTSQSTRSNNSVKLLDFTTIKFNRLTPTQTRKLRLLDFNGNLFSLQHIGQQDSGICVFQLLGRIFYKKLRISSLSITDDFILYTRMNSLRSSNGSLISNISQSIPPSQVSKISDSRFKVKSSRVLSRIHTFKKEINSSNSTESTVSEKKNLPRRFLISDSEEIVNNKSSSFDEEQIFSSDEMENSHTRSNIANKNKSIDNRVDSVDEANNFISKSDSSFDEYSVYTDSSNDVESKIYSELENYESHSKIYHRNSIGMAISHLKQLIAPEDLNATSANFYTSFQLFESFVYENFIFFVTMEDLPQAYSAISYSEFSPECFLAFLQCILQCKDTQKKSFFSFKPSKLIFNKFSKKLRISEWRYKNYLN